MRGAEECPKMAGWFAKTCVCRTWPLVMLKDPRTGEPTSNVQGMDEILHETWDKVMRKYTDTPEPDPDKFVQRYSHFIEKKADLASAPITGARLRKRLKKMGVRTAMGLDGWCVADLLCLPDSLLNMLADLLAIVEATGKWPRILARGYVSLIPKGEGMLPMQQRPLSVLSQLYRVWAGLRLEECIVWQESWAHPHAFGFRKKRDNDEDGIEPVFGLRARARRRRASSTSSAVRRTR